MDVHIKYHTAPTPHVLFWKPLHLGPGTQLTSTCQDSPQCQSLYETKFFLKVRRYSPVGKMSNTSIHECMMYCMHHTYTKSIRCVSLLRSYLFPISPNMPASLHHPSLLAQINTIPLLTPPHPRTLARSLPVPRGSTATGGLTLVLSPWGVAVLSMISSRTERTQPAVPSPPHTKMRRLGTWMNIFKLCM